MDIAILGGTGDIGRGLALRLAADTDHDVHIGSREAEKAKRRAAEYGDTLDASGVTGTIAGDANAAVAREAELVVLAVPPYHVRELTSEMGDQLDEDAILVSPAVGMSRDEAGFHYDRPGAGSVTELVAETAPDANPVVGAYHNLAADRLADLDADLGLDTLVVGEDPAAKATVMEVTRGIEGLRPLDAGPLANAAEIEAITPLLINVARNNDEMHDLGVRFT